jgi:hypothetical protein
MLSRRGWWTSPATCIAVVSGVLLGSAGCAGAGSGPSSPSGAPTGSDHAPQATGDIGAREQGSSEEALTNAKVEDRLRKFMLGLPPHSSVQRIALADVAYPANSEENRKLGGFTLILVTAVTHEPTELPPHVHFRHSSGDLALPLLLSRIGAVDPPDLRKVFGSLRFDGLYAIPIQATQTEGAVLANFQNVSRDFRLLDFPKGNLPEGVEAIPPSEPDMTAVRSFAEREFPIVEERDLTR